MKHKGLTAKMIASHAITSALPEQCDSNNTSIINHKHNHTPPPQTHEKYFFLTGSERFSPVTTSAVVILGIYTMFFVQTQSLKTVSEIQALEKNIIAQMQIASIKQEKQYIPKENSLYIPKLDVLTEISEGEYEDQKKYDLAWRRTHTSTPEAGGNTVIVGHRYRDNTPDYPLYDIDQISNDDEIIVYWDGTQYTYTVHNTMEVHETAIEIEDDTDENLLTLYACDWTGKKRLVVQAKLKTEEI